MRFRLLAATALAAGATTLGAAAPAHATTFVTVHFGLSAGTYAPTGVACSLTVPAASDGVAVLDAAVASHCIVSYHTVTFTGVGTFVDRINEVCGQFLTGNAGTYWNMYENSVSTAYGVDGFSADEGDELVFAYTAYCFCP